MQSGRRSSLTHGRVSPFLLFELSTDWMRPTHIQESNLLYSVSTDWMRPTHIQESNLLYSAY